MLSGGWTVTTEFADTFGSATLVAVTFRITAVFTIGAVNNPLAEIVPPVTDQVTPFRVLPLTIAWNGCVVPAFIVRVAGVIVTDTAVLASAGGAARARNVVRTATITISRGK